MSGGDAGGTSLHVQRTVHRVEGFTALKLSQDLAPEGWSPVTEHYFLAWQKCIGAF